MYMTTCNEKFIIKPISSCETHPIRKIVLRPNQDEKSVIFEGDDLESTFHAGLYINEKLVSVASIYKNSLEDSDSDGWQLRAMATLPEYQGKGHGSKLLQTCINHVQENDGSYIWCNARKNVVNYYKKFGFNVISDEFEIAGIGPHYIMVLKFYYNVTIDFKEKTILEKLDQIIREPQIINLLISLIEEAKNEKFFPITENIPLSLFKDKLPRQINLCRIFILPPNTKSKIEKHKNSFQRTVTVFGSGDTKILNNDLWISNVKRADGKTIEERWLSVPEDTWHQPISGKEDWITVTFHTALESDIVDEYREP